MAKAEKEVLKPEALLNLLEDLEKEKQEKEAGEKKYRALFEGSSDAIFVIKDYRFTDCNELTLQMFGCKDKDEVVGHRPEEFSPKRQPDGQLSAKKAKKLIDRALKGEKLDFYWKHRQKGGAPFDAEVSLNRVKLDSKGFIQAIVRDITEKKKAQEEARREKERAEKYFETANVMLVALNHKGEVERINQKGAEIIGHEKKDIMGKNWFENFIPKQQRKPVKAVFKKLMAGDVKMTATNENPILDKNGNERHIRWHNTLLKDDKGRIIGTLSSGQDITQRKKLEVAREEFLRNVAHELKTPVTIMQLNLEKLMRMHLPPESLKSLNVLRRGTSRFQRQIERLMALSRFEAGLATYQYTKLDLSKIAKEILNDFKDLAKAKHLKLELDLAGQLPLVKADKEKIKEVMENFLSNAVKFTEKGGVTIRLCKKNHSVCFSVTDTGCGIAEKDWPNVFQKFFRVETGLARSTPGSGIGLALAKQIVEGHKGDIGFSSKLGKGSTFYFCLPAKGR